MKRRNIVFTILKLMPFLVAVVFTIVNMKTGSYTTMQSVLLDFGNLCGDFNFGTVGEVVYDLLYNNLELSDNLSNILSSVVSYEIIIMFLQIAYSVITFLPQFCINVFERKTEK